MDKPRSGEPQCYSSYERRFLAMGVGALILSLLLPTAVLLAAMPPTGALGQRPTVFALPPRFNAPTPNLNLVANALGLKTKSLSILLTAQPGLAVTNPVNIRVTYNSSVTGSRWIQNIYDAKNGYRNFHNDPDGNRAKRHMKLDILLTEQQPGNQFVNFPITWEIDLDPLFDVAITPLRFKLNTSCERFYEGDADIHFLWYSPDAPKYSERSFQSSKGKTTVINEFAWARQEVSAAANLFFPTFSFYEKDTNVFSPLQYDIPKPSYKLLPGSSGYVGRTLNDSSGQKGCSADIAFDINITIRQYLNL
jgi:hypothetical protein